MKLESRTSESNRGSGMMNSTQPRCLSEVSKSQFTMSVYVGKNVYHL